MGKLSFQKIEEDPRNFAPELECHMCEGIIGEPIAKGGCIHQDLSKEEYAKAERSFDNGYAHVGIEAAGRTGSLSYLFRSTPGPAPYTHPEAMRGYKSALADWGVSNTPA